MPRSTPSAAPNPIVEMVTMAACRSLLDTLPPDGQGRVLSWLAQSLGARPASAKTPLPDLNKELRKVVADAVRSGSLPSSPGAAQPGHGKPGRPAGRKAAPARKVPPPVTRSLGKRGPGRPVLPVDPSVDLGRLSAFLATRTPRTQAERAAALAAFLAENGEASFLPRRLAALNRAAGNRDFSNITVAMKIGAEKGWLRRNGDGTWSSINPPTLSADAPPPAPEVPATTPSSEG